MRTLLHACCAPCAIQCVASLRGEGIAPRIYWYNPNIHPFTEYRCRRDALCAFAKAESLPLSLRDEYGLRPFLEAVVPDIAQRCRHCYRVRLNETAGLAAQAGFDSFSTTLLISPYQSHTLLREIGEEAASLHGVPFLYRDFRPLFRAGQKAARSMGVYMQKYCGCVFSEEERYRGTQSPLA